VSRAREKGAYIAALTNVTHSSLDRLADLKLSLGVGVEYAVASTKAFIFMLMFFVDLVAALTQVDLLSEKKRYQTVLSSLYGPARKNELKKLSKKISPHSHLYFISHGDLVPLGYEGALKFKEIGYLHAENIVSGEIKHGPLALVTDNTLCLVLCRAGSHELDSTIAEIKARGGEVILLALPDLGTLTPLYGANLLHMVSFYHAVLLGHNPDQPRNLAKSVTVK
jgi:glucosamine--fructose-6-phosphate aminotransferase (isomerizing)